MAKIHEEIVVIKLSHLVKDDSNEDTKQLVSPETLEALEQVAQELFGTDGVIIEAEKA